MVGWLVVVAEGGLPQDGPSDVTEYFLIGSFASWMFALGGLALLQLQFSHGLYLR